MIYGVQLAEALFWYLLLIFTPLTDWLLGQVGVTNAVVLRLGHGLAMAWFGWRAWSALYGEKAEDEAKKVWKRPNKWTWAGLAFLAVVFFNVFNIVGRLTDLLGTAMPFEATTESARNAARLMGERFVTGLLTLAGVAVVKGSVYGQPRTEKPKKEPNDEARARADDDAPARKGRKRGAPEKKPAARGLAGRIRGFLPGGSNR